MSAPENGPIWVGFLAKQNSVCDETQANMKKASAFSLIEITFEACLLPVDLQNISNGIKRCLFSKLLQYSEEAEGVIVAFKNIKLLNRKSEIVDESPFIRFNVKADCLVFKPQRGMEINGTVNMVGLHYIGLIVCGLFNASIPEDLMPKGSSYDTASRTWTINGTTMEIGATLKVKVDRIHDNNGMLSMLCSVN